VVQGKPGIKEGTLLKFLTHKDKSRIIQAIMAAEKMTSGELRVHIDKKAGKDPFLRAQEVFAALGMDQTRERNGVLFYLAVEDRRFVILGDEGINSKVPADFWEGIKEAMAAEFREERFTEGLLEGIRRAGEALAQYFPYRHDDRDELPNEISTS
jgi:uncharacterized membrane protein